jgi:hypothetical protein
VDAVADVVAFIVMLALWAGVSFALLLWTIAPTIKFFGETASPEEIALSDRREPWAIAGAALLAGLIAAFFRWARRRGASWAFGLLGAAVVLLPLMYASATRDPAPVDPRPGGCVARSGGTNTCPGG